MRYRRKVKVVLVEASRWMGWKEGPHDLGIVHECEIGGRHYVAKKVTNGLVGGIADFETMSVLGPWEVSPGDWVLTRDDHTWKMTSEDFEEQYELAN